MSVFYKFVDVCEFLGEGGIIAVVVFCMMAFLGFYFFA